MTPTLWCAATSHLWLSPRPPHSTHTHTHAPKSVCPEQATASHPAASPTAAHSSASSARQPPAAPVQPRVPHALQTLILCASHCCLPVLLQMYHRDTPEGYNYETYLRASKFCMAPLGCAARGCHAARRRCMPESGWQPSPRVKAASCCRPHPVPQPCRQVHPCRRPCKAPCHPVCVKAPAWLPVRWCSWGWGNRVLQVMMAGCVPVIVQVGTALGKPAAPGAGHRAALLCLLSRAGLVGNRMCAVCMVKAPTPSQTRTQPAAHALHPGRHMSAGVLAAGQRGCSALRGFLYTVSFGSQARRWRLPACWHSEHAGTRLAPAPQRAAPAEPSPFPLLTAPRLPVRCAVAPCLLTPSAG